MEHSSLLNLVSIVWSMDKKFSYQKDIFAKFVVWLQSQSKSKDYELTLFCSCHNKNKNKENNNPNIQDMSVLVVLNFVKRLKSQKKDQALMERVQCIHICIRISLVWGVRNREISKWRPHPHSYVGAQNIFFIRTSLVHKSDTQRGVRIWD